MDSNTKLSYLLLDRVKILHKNLQASNCINQAQLPFQLSPYAYYINIPNLNLASPLYIMQNVMHCA